MTNSTSNAVQHRIMTTFSNMHNWVDRELVLANLAFFFEGGHIHVNDGWKQSRGHSSLIANKEGRRVLKILKAADVSVQFGNDAPRGGEVGAYFKCLRKNTAAAAFFRDMLAEAKTK